MWQSPILSQKDLEKTSCDKFLMDSVKLNSTILCVECFFPYKTNSKISIPVQSSNISAMLEFMGSNNN